RRGEVGRGVLDGVVDVRAGDVDRQAHPVVRKLLDLRRHLPIRPETRGAASRRLGRVRVFVIARHGESTLNLERRVNGDPSVPVTLTDKGRAEATLLGQQIAPVPLELCIHTRFSRTAETAEIALAGRDVALLEEPLL